MLKGGQLPTYQLHLHDTNWGALNHASRASQLVSCNYMCYACMCESERERERDGGEERTS